MHETAADLAAIQGLLDAGAAAAGPGMRSIITAVFTFHVPAAPPRPA